MMRVTEVAAELTDSDAGLPELESETGKRSTSRAATRWRSTPSHGSSPARREEIEERARAAVHGGEEVR